MLSPMEGIELTTHITSSQWRFRYRALETDTLTSLVAYWEVQGDAISNQYLPSQITAADLLTEWVTRIGRSKGLIPVYWYVKGDGLLELMPFQHSHLLVEPQHNFLTFFSWPTDPATGEHLNWLRLPVVDKRWHGEIGDKGGFIQEATGWKPAILQPFLALESLFQGKRIVDDPPR